MFSLLFLLDQVLLQSIDNIKMVSVGLLACEHSMSSVFCIVRIIQFIVSLVMFCMVIAILMMRLRRQFRLNFYVIVSITMMLTLLFIMAYSINGDIAIFNYLYLYFYNAYFSIIVFKLATKILEKYKQALYYKFYRFIMHMVFVIYAALVLAALIYRIVQIQDKCLELPFLIANAFNLTAALLFLTLGINHIKWQSQKIDGSFPSNEQNNPLPRLRVWIALNCLGQLMVLVQAVIYQVNGCVFSSNTTTNQIVNLIFVFFCFHTGILSTLYFFLHTAPDIQSKGMIRKNSTNSSTGVPRIEIQLAYHDFDEIRTKMVSQ